MNYIDLKIRNKLALVMILFVLTVIVILSALYFYQFNRALRERVLLQLSSVKQLKSALIEQQFADILEIFEKDDLSGTMPEITLFSGHIDQDTIILGYPVKAVDYPREQIFFRDLTLQDSSGKITLAIHLNTGDSSRVALIQPDVQSILMERTGLGETGETYIVGPDKRMRTSSRFFPNVNPTTIRLDSKDVTMALEGKEGTGLIMDYRDVRVFSAFEQLNIHGLKWVILSEIDEEEALFPLRELRKNLTIVLGFLLVFILVGSYQLSSQLVKPLILMEEVLSKMSVGIFERAARLSRGDEIGEMFRALDKLIQALQQTVTFANKIGAGNFEAEYDLLGPDDQLGHSLILMKERLRTYQQNEKLLKLENQRSLIRGEEKERARLSQELHDGLGPMLTILRIKVQSLDIPGNQMEKLMKLFDETIGEMRKISNNLMPSVLTDFGAGEAIRNLVNQLNMEGLHIQYNYDPDPKIDIPKGVSIAVYRVVQEAVNNVIRHAEASTVKISLTEFPDKISLFLKDDGKGFNLEEIYQSNGIRNMRERVNVENGIFEITSGEGGTIIEVEIPLNESN